jgi:hypothetical protein
MWAKLELRVYSVLFKVKLEVSVSLSTGFISTVFLELDVRRQLNQPDSDFNAFPLQKQLVDVWA